MGYNENLSLQFEESQPEKKGGDLMRTDYISPGDLEAVFRALTPENELVLRVCEETGIRVGDALSLRTDDLKERMTIVESKTGKRRRIRFRRALLDALKSNAGGVYVFEGRLDATKHRTRQAVWKDIKRAAKAFRITQNVGPHSVRKLYAVELAKRGYELDEIQKRLNHDSAAVTALYLMAGLIATDTRPKLGPKRRARPKTSGKRKATGEKEITGTPTGERDNRKRGNKKSPTKKAGNG